MILFFNQHVITKSYNTISFGYIVTLQKNQYYKVIMIHIVKFQEVTLIAHRLKYRLTVI